VRLLAPLAAIGAQFAISVLLALPGLCENAALQWRRGGHQ
jgi:hypothetical protein